MSVKPSPELLKAFEVLLPLQKKDCPEFEDGYEKVLEWSKASVGYGDEFVNGKGEIKVRPNLGHWTMSWQYGFMGFFFLKEDEKKARVASAMFIYLWCKDIPASLADNLAVTYASKFSEID